MTARFADFLARLRRSSGDQDRARLAAILELNRALATAQDRRALLRLLLDQAIALFAAERGFVIRPDEASSSGVRVELARSLDREPVRQPERKVSMTVVSKCLADGTGIFTEDAQEGDFAAAASVADLKLRSVLCMPLSLGDRRLGCIYLDHRFRSGAFREDDLPWFQAFADQAVIALHVHDLLEQVRVRSRVIEQSNQELAARVAAQQEQLTMLEAELRRDGLAYEYPHIRGSSPALLRHLHLLDRVVDGEYPVLLIGESGSGKEFAARAIWANGRRAAGPFVPVHVAAISPGLLESELFGHVKGAFTGAERDRAGLLREADGGVLFLDEITETEPDLQVKLLRVLEDHVVRPVGSDATYPVDLRIIAATNRDPVVEIEARRFRADLYYRLAVVTIRVPPLRERSGDLPELVASFLAQAARERGAAEARTAAPELCCALARRGWPGNLRQLRNEVFRLDAMADGAVVGVEQLEPEDRGVAVRPPLDLAALESWALREALNRSGGNKAEAARLLGISRRALYNKLDREADREADREPDRG